MADASKTLQIVVSLKDGVSKSIGNVQARIGKLTGAVFNLKTALLGLGIGAVAKGFTDVALSFEKYETVLKTITGSSEKAKGSMEWISDFTATTPYELGQVTDAFVKMKAYGFDPTTGALNTLGDTAAAMGKGLMQAVEMFADAATGEFERLKEFGVRASQQGDEVTFKWVENGKQMVRTAEKTQTGITTALIDVFATKYSGAMDDLSRTASGMWSNIKDQFTLFQKKVMDSDVFDYIKGALSLILEKINKLKEEGRLDEWAEDIGRKIVSSFKSMALGVAGFYDVVAPIISNFKKAFSEIWDWFKSLPTEVQNAGLVLAVMGGKSVKLAIAGLMLMNKSISEIKDTIKVMTYEAVASSTEVENLKRKLEALIILKEKAEKTKGRGEGWWIFGGETSEEDIAKINEQIKITQNKLTQLTPIKIFPEEAETEAEAESMLSFVIAAIEKWEKRAKGLEGQAAKKTPTEETTVEPDKKKAPTIPAIEASKMATDRLKADIETQLAELDVMYEEGLRSFSEYWFERQQKLDEQYKAELDLLKKMAEAETDPTKKLAAETEYYVRMQEYKQANIELTNEEKQAEEELALKKLELDDILKDLHERAASERLTELDAIHAEETARLDRRQQEEMQRIMDLTEFMESEEEKRAAIEQAYRDQAIEKDKLLAAQKKEILEQQLSDAAKIADGLFKISNELYKMSGKQNEKAFKAAKAFAIAKAILNGIVAVSRANDGTYMGYANMAIAAALAGIQVAKIRSTEMGGSFAEGGMIPGRSPHSKSDNIPINATAGEYMQPVPAVQYYGKRVMDGIKDMVFPPELFSGFRVPAMAHASGSRTRYAEGGPVRAFRKVATTAPKIEIINVTNPEAIRGLAIDAVHENRDMVVNMVLQGLEDKNISLQRDYS